MLAYLKFGAPKIINVWPYKKVYVAKAFAHTIWISSLRDCQGLLIFARQDLPPFDVQ